ncbi:MAG: DUF6273 domain-containing protein [bacterium]|nr:DUF6273 domain-containing protein [bacterium]
MSNSAIETENFGTPSEQEGKSSQDTAPINEVAPSQDAAPSGEAVSLKAELPDKAAPKSSKGCWKKAVIAVSSLVLLCIVLFLGFVLITAYFKYKSDGEVPLPAVDNKPTPVASASVYADASYEVGSYVKIGRYTQYGGDAPEPIEWLVLDNDGKEALLLSRFGLDCKPFHHEKVDISWRDCDLRKWLNSDFLDEAFTDDEKRCIAESNTGNDKDETLDKVFCLSLDEAYKYFGDVSENMGCKERWHTDIEETDWWVNRERSCQPTAFAISHGAVQGKNISKKKGKIKTPEWWVDNCLFWLRSPGARDNRATYVTFSGAAGKDGAPVTAGIFAVRPAMRVKL